MEMMNHQPHYEEVSTKLGLFDNPWKIMKTLTSSDVSEQQCRILLPADLVDAHVLRFWNADLIAKANTLSGTRVRIRDLNTHSDHQLTFKRWPSSNSYIINNNWAKEFVRRRNLQIGDEIGLFWHPYDSHFCFSAFRNGRVLG